MSAPNLMEMIRRRHDGPAWIVIDEVGNGTGSHVSRHADAVALGIWPSQGYEIHGYEIKVSRSDVQKELRDPSKADAVGKFCDYWWLAIADEKLIDGLTIPPTWGILVPKARVLRAIRKAPKRTDVTPINRSFFAALTRRVVAGWVPRSTHEAVKNASKEEVRKELLEERRWDKETAERELNQLRDQVARFQEASGVELGQPWDADKIGAAVKAVLRAQEMTSPRWVVDPVSAVDQHALALDRKIEGMEAALAHMRGAKKSLARFRDELAADTPAPCDASHPAVGEDRSLLDA